MSEEGIASSLDGENTRVWPEWPLNTSTELKYESSFELGFCASCEWEPKRCIFLHTFKIKVKNKTNILSMESGFEYERPRWRCAHRAGAKLFSSSCAWATESRPPAARSPGRLFRAGLCCSGVPFSGFMCDRRVISVSNERAARL